MYVDMWMDLLKRLPLDEKYHHPAMEGLVGLLGFLESIKNHMQYAKACIMMVVCV